MTKLEAQLRRNGLAVKHDRTADQHVADAMLLEVREMHDKLTRWAPMLERMGSEEAGSARVRLMEARDNLHDMWRQLRTIAA